MLFPLVLYANIPCVLLFDGMMLGEISPDMPAVVQVLSHSRHYACAIPIGPGYLTSAEKFLVEDGRLKEPRGINWPDCMEFTFAMQPCPSFSPAAILDTLQTDSAQASLFYECGVHMALERNGQVFFSKTLAPSGMGKLYACGEDVLAITDVGAIAVDAANGTVLFEADGACEYDGSTLTCRKRLNDIPGHVQSSVYDPQERKLLDASFIREITPTTGKEAALALLEAVRLDLSNEIPDLLDGDLRGLECTELRSFFGQWHKSLSHPFRSDVFGLWEPDSGNARAFRFDTDDTGERVRVVNVSQL